MVGKELQNKNLLLLRPAITSLHEAILIARF
jgi:hypothetical protein